MGRVVLSWWGPGGARAGVVGGPAGVVAEQVDLAGGVLAEAEHGVVDAVAAGQGGLEDAAALVLSPRVRSFLTRVNRLPSLVRPLSVNKVKSPKT